MQILTKIGFTALLFASSTLGVITPVSPEIEAVATSTPVVVETPHIWSEQDTKSLIYAKAIEYGTDADLMLRIVECETAHSIASTTIQSRHYRDGIREQSYGLVQINLPHNPDLTYEQATDPLFSIDYLAKQLKAGRGFLWSCFSMVN